MGSKCTNVCCRNCSIVNSISWLVLSCGNLSKIVESHCCWTYYEPGLRNVVQRWTSFFLQSYPLSLPFLFFFLLFFSLQSFLFYSPPPPFHQTFLPSILPQTSETWNEKSIWELNWLRKNSYDINTLAQYVDQNELNTFP